MRKSLGPELPTVVKINVTPIIDVALVLVIILLVTAPILTVADVDLELPPAHTRGAEDEQRISISLGRDGALAVDEEYVTLDRMGREIRARLSEWGDKNTLVVVRADQGATHGEIKALMQEIKNAGAVRVAMGTTQAGKEDQ